MGLQIPSLAIIILLLWPCVLSAPVAPADQPLQCQRKCGDQTVLYPFGILGDSEDCFRNSSYTLRCNHTHFNPPKLFFSNLPILNISVETATMIVQFYAAVTCYNESGVSSTNCPVYMNLTDMPFTISSTLNMFKAIGCDTQASLFYEDDKLGTRCPSTCDNSTSIPDKTQITQVVEPCSNLGCCQTKIPKGFKYIQITLGSLSNHSGLLGSNPCDYAFLTGPNARLVQSTAFESISSEVVLDWAVGDTTCEEERKSICGPNTDCLNSNYSSGYRCSCRQGYAGNPFTVQGCQGNGGTKATVSSANAYTMPGSYISYMVLLAVGFCQSMLLIKGCCYC